MTARNASGAPACDTVEVARALVRGERGAVLEGALAGLRRAQEPARGLSEALPE